MNRLEFVALEAPFAFDYCKTGGSRKQVSLGKDMFHAVRAYVDEGVGLLVDTGYDPFVLAVSHARQAAREYAAFRLGVRTEMDWKRARKSWRVQAAKDFRRAEYPVRDDLTRYLPGVSPNPNLYPETKNLL